MADPLGCLDELPRARLVEAPTPLERLANLTARTGGAEILAKRDDTQPLAFGGNKLRQLEFYFGAAQAQGADTVLITGAVQSNFCRLATAAAAKLGMACHVQMEERVPSPDPLYRSSGNVLVERLLGATLHSYSQGEDEAGADARLEAIAEALRQAGHRPYVIHLAPGHPPLGALGYVVAARELVGQLNTQGVAIDHVVVPSGSGATHAGLLFGLRALGVSAPVTGVCVRRDAAAQKPRLERRCREIADLLGIACPVAPEDVVVDEAYLAPGYGRLNAATSEAIRAAAETEALMLDPVYSGKTMAACLDIAVRLGGGTVLFLHSGGTPAIFAYEAKLAEAMGWREPGAGEG